jgi:hypothetical protein
MAWRTDIEPEGAAKVIALVCVEIDKAREWITSEAGWSRSWRPWRMRR